MRIDSLNGRIWNSGSVVGKGAGLVFTGTITPVDPATGLIVDSPTSEDATRFLHEVPFVRIIQHRLVTQTLRCVGTLSDQLADAGSSLDRLAHLRIFMRDIAGAGIVAEALARLLGDKAPSAEILQMGSRGVSGDILVALDAIAVSTSSGHAVRHVHSGGPRLLGVFPAATVAGPYTYTSSAPPITPSGAFAGDPAAALSARAAALIADLPPTSPGWAVRFARQHATAFDNALSALEAAGLAPNSVVHQKDWYAHHTMQKLLGGSAVMGITSLVFPYLLSTFVVEGLLEPEWQATTRLIAVNDPASKVADGPPHALAPVYHGMLQAGPLLMTSGEVPIDPADSSSMSSVAALPQAWRSMSLGRMEAEKPVLAQCRFIYDRIAADLAAMGAKPGDVIHQSVYLTDAGDQTAVLLACRALYGDVIPATSFVPIVGATPSTASRVEIETIAINPNWEGTTPQ